MTKLALQLVSFLSLVTASTLCNADNSDLVHQVRCAEIAFSISLEKKNKSAFASLIGRDARFVSGSSTVTSGRDAVVDAWSGFFAEDATLLTWRPLVIQVLDSENLALSRGPYRISGTNSAGEHSESWGFYNSIWRRNGKNGAWHIVFDAGDATNQPPSEEMLKAMGQPIDDCDDIVAYLLSGQNAD